MGEGVHTLNPLFWKIQSYGTYQVIHLYCKITFKMANKQKLSLGPRSWEKKLWIRAWLVFAFGLMQVNNLTLGCNSILY